MENLPIGEPPETNIPPSKELVPLTASTDFVMESDLEEAPLHDDQADETTPIEEQMWANILGFTLQSDSVSPRAFRNIFNLDYNTAQAVMEELQAQGIVTKHRIERPGSGALKDFDSSKYGGYMVLYGSNGNKQGSKRPPTPIELPSKKEHHPKPRPESKLKRYIGRATVRQTLAHEVQDYIELNKRRVVGAGDLLSGKKAARSNDAIENGVDRLYAEVFDKNGQLDADGTPIVPSWMAKNKVAPWRRTVPSLKIIDPNAVPDEITPVDRRSDAEREVDIEIETMRSDGENDEAIKRELLKKYHPDREDGGDVEKVKRVTYKFMRDMEHSEPAPMLVKPDIDAIINESNRTAARQQQAAEAASVLPEQDQRINDPSVQWALKYIASGDRSGQHLPRLSKESLVGAFLRHGQSLASVEDTYKYLHDSRVVDDRNTVNPRVLAELLEKSKPTTQ